MTVPTDLQNAMARTRNLDVRVQLGKAQAVRSEIRRPSSQDSMAPGTVAYRQLQANLAAAFGHFEELEALEEEGIEPESMTAVEACPTYVEGEYNADSETNEWPLPSKSQFTHAWPAQGWLKNAMVHGNDEQPKMFRDHAWWPAGGELGRSDIEAQAQRQAMASAGQPVMCKNSIGAFQAASRS